jgi:hypothetical protein
MSIAFYTLYGAGINRSFFARISRISRFHLSPHAVASNRSIAVSCALIALLMALGPVAAHAKPEYAAKEGKACQYCHVSASPGLRDPVTREVEPFTRNNRGLYYAAHNHSFAGYVERQVMGTSAPPVFHFAWREILTDAPRRIAVADVTGDGKPRFISLNEKPGSKTEGILTVKRWDGNAKAFVTEFTAETHSAPDHLAVGRYVGADRPAVIVTSDALWYWNGKTFEQKAAGQPLPLFGSTRLKDGTERLLLAPTPMDVKAYSVDLKAAGAGWLVGGTAVPAPDLVSWGDMHASTDFFDKMGMPTELAQGGLVGVWDVRKFGKTFVYHSRINQDFDVKPDPAGTNKPQFILKSQSWCVGFMDPTDPKQGGQGNSRAFGVYYTPVLAGEIYDIATESARGDGVPGLLILTSEVKDGKGRSLYFFPLD